MYTQVLCVCIQRWLFCAGIHGEPRRRLAQGLMGGAYVLSRRKEVAIAKHNNREKVGCLMMVRIILTVER